jgi:hypothetical protein
MPTKHSYQGWSSKADAVAKGEDLNGGTACISSIHRVRQARQLWSSENASMIKVIACRVIRLAISLAALSPGSWASGGRYSSERIRYCR